MCYLPYISPPKSFRQVRKDFDSFFYCVNYKDKPLFIFAGCNRPPSREVWRGSHIADSYSALQCCELTVFIFRSWDKFLGKISFETCVKYRLNDCRVI